MFIYWFDIVRCPARLCSRNLSSTVFVILHNMIIKDDHGLELDFEYDNVGRRVKPRRNPDRIQAFLEKYRKIEDRASPTQLCEELIVHQ